MKTVRQPIRCIEVRPISDESAFSRRRSGPAILEKLVPALSFQQLISQIL
jgi:hypothetical protein